MTEKKENPLHVVTPEIVRFSYVHLAEPVVDSEGKAKYSVQLLIPKTNKKTLQLIRKAQEEAFKSKKGHKIFYDEEFEDVSTTLRDGDAEFPKDPNYKGMMFMTVSNQYKPDVVGTQRDERGKFKPIDPSDMKEIYSGMWGRAGMDFYAFDASKNKGITASLATVQKVQDDDVLGGFHADADADFADFVDQDDDEEDLI